MSTSMENVCRTCMGESCQEKASRRRKSSSLISIFIEPESHKNNGNSTLIDLLRITNPQLMIESDDLLPKTMCSTCVDRLLDSHEFQQMCIRVEQRLRETAIKEDEDDDESKDQLDPLNNSLTQPAFNDLRVLKVEMDELDEPMIDNTEIMDDKNIVEINKAEDNLEYLDDNDDFKNDSSSDDGEYSDWDVDLDEKTKKDYKTDRLETSELEDVDNEDKTEKESSKDRKPFTCKDCGKRLKTLKSLSRHQERLHSENVKPLINECKFCGKVFEKKNVLRKHLKTHNENQDMDKTKDKTESKNDNDIKNANNKTESTEDNEESLCTDSINSAVKLEEDNQEKDSVPNDQTAKVKQKAAKKNKQFYCMQCAYGLKSRESWIRHIKRVHSGIKPEAKTYKCKHCEIVFDEYALLKKHWKVHAGGEKACLCPECGKSFNSLGNMNQHLLRHGTDRPYECPHCPLRYPTLSDLASHKLMHTKVKPHVCDVCGMAFVRPSLLKTHKKYHTGEKNYKCDFCDMRFVLGSQCRTHMRTHTGEKPFKCDYCPSAFIQGGDLKKHLRTHLGINVYRCNMCPQAFRLRSILREHLISHKNEDEETRLKNLQALKNEDLLLQLKFGLMPAAGEEQ